MSENGAPPEPVNHAWQRLEDQLGWQDRKSGHQKVWFQALKHQKFLYLAQAGPYRDATVRDAVLAERVEALVSQEHSSWSATQTEPTAAAAR